MTDIDKALETVTAEVCARVIDGKPKHATLAALHLAELGQVGAFLDARATPVQGVNEYAGALLQAAKAFRDGA